jgi:hypothetical protein
MKNKKGKGTRNNYNKGIKIKEYDREKNRKDSREWLTVKEGTERGMRKMRMISSPQFLGVMTDIKR